LFLLGQESYAFLDHKLLSTSPLYTLYILAVATEPPVDLHIWNLIQLPHITW